MPNIEIHGLAEAEAKTMYSQVERALRNSPVANNVVISRYSDVVKDLLGYDRPYLRIVCTDEVEAQQVAGLLKPLNLDLEIFRLRAFIPH
jgi:hypothetical protein